MSLSGSTLGHSILYSSITQSYIYKYIPFRFHSFLFTPALSLYTARIRVVYKNRVRGPPFILFPTTLIWFKKKKNGYVALKLIQIITKALYTIKFRYSCKNTCVMFDQDIFSSFFIQRSSFESWTFLSRFGLQFCVLDRTVYTRKTIFTRNVRNRFLHVRLSQLPMKKRNTLGNELMMRLLRSAL